MRVLAVDSGEKRIGLAISDVEGKVARSLRIFSHINRLQDAHVIYTTAMEMDVQMIIVGYSVDESGQPNLAGRRTKHLAEEIRRLGDIPVELWDESLSTKDAQEIRRKAGFKRKNRGGHLDDIAAAVILQSYLDVINDMSRIGHDENNE